jgi:myo-inositol-hexaphosphate 3-phosphohydrolase
LKRDLDKLAQWEQLWKMAIYPEKWNVLTISRNKVSVKFNYCLHGHVLESVDQGKYPGVAISEDLKW